MNTKITNIADIRTDYTKHKLNKESVNDDPVAQFRQWLDEAIQAQVTEVNAMTLSTINADNRPSSRIMLLKGVEEGLFLFYSNYLSNKGKEIANHPYGAINFYWHELERQVRIEGKIALVSKEQSDTYFSSRPRGSQISAATSPQSAVIDNRQILEERYALINKKYSSKPVSRPSQWGGYSLTPDYFEFWQGRANRLHDRIAYRLDADQWHKDRLAP